MHSNASRWPARLWLVRHGQSAGNVARDAAHAAGLDRIAIAGRDVDVPLSPLGEQQADALGRWFAAGRGNGRPEVILCSPYLRARETARRFRDSGGADPDEAICADERLREKEFGILDGLTTSGIAAHQVVVLCLRYVIENLSEDEILAIDREADVANCSVTEYAFDPGMGKDGGLRLARYNEVAPIEEDAVAHVTRAPDPIVAARG